MRRVRVAVVGYGRLGRACVEAVRASQDVELAGIVARNAEAVTTRLTHGHEAVEHVRMLENVHGALVCVPAEQGLAVARELLQQHVPVVECARLEGQALQAHRAGIAAAAHHHRVAAVLGAGWDPGALTVIARLFDVLIPRGHSERESRPGMLLHHMSAPLVPGVRAARVCERRSAESRSQRYVYLELERGADAARIAQAYIGDPLYAGTDTFVFPVPDVSALEAAASGIVVRRYAAHATGTHESLLLEARFDDARFAAAVMLDAARALPRLAAGAHVYCSALGLAAVEA